MTDKLISILELEQLQHLLPFFTDQGVTDSVLKDLTDADLKELGVDKLGERKRLLAAFGKSGGGAAAVSVVEEAAAQASGDAPSKTATTAAEATKDSPWVNTLGMPFVPIPRFDTRFCIWPVRVQDYEAYCVAAGAKFPEIPFPQDGDHPIVGVSWNDAIEFCVWLTGKERSVGKIDEQVVYRLPTDLEWSAAVGLPHEPEATPAERHLKARGYPWGLRWPPPIDSGNYEPAREDQAGFRRISHDARGFYNNSDTGERVCAFLTDIHQKWQSDWPRGVDDFLYTSPVGSFTANSLGICDLGGNVWEWCMDSLSTIESLKVLRGASYCTSYEKEWRQTTSIIGEFQKVWLYNAPDNKTPIYDEVFVPYSNKVLYQNSFRNACSQDGYSITRLPKDNPPNVLNHWLDDNNSRTYPINGFRIVVAPIL